MEQNWVQVKKIFYAALSMDRDMRSEFISQQCEDDKDLIAEIETLLASHESAEGFMEFPAVGEVADVIETGLPLGESLKHYQIVRKIGTGGMGEVYLAEDTKLGRKVAVKVLNKSFASDRSNLARFLREARVASSLNHPNIMTVHEIGELGEINYIVTEFIEGETLVNYAINKNSNLAEIIELCRQMCGALIAAHEIGIIHRDIKPDNIMVREDGLLKILDFGLAKQTHFELDQNDLDLQTSDAISTQKGMILGTVVYMSPEQARGKEVDTRTDIWSFGVVLFELLSGRRPFQGETTSDVIAAVLKNRPPPLSDLVSNLPNDLEEIVKKCLSKNPKYRYQESSQLLSALSQIYDYLKSSSSAITIKRSQNLETSNEHRTDYELVATTAKKNNIRDRVSGFFGSSLFADGRLFLSLTFVLILFVLAGGYLASSFIFSWKSESDLFQQMQVRKLTDERLASPISAISPDGKLIAYITAKSGGQSLRVKQVVGEGFSELLPPSKNSYAAVFFSHDQQDVFFSTMKPNRLSSLHKIPVIGGQPQAIATGVDGQTIKVSPDGKFVAYIENGRSLKTLELDSDKQKVVATASSGEYWYNLGWSADNMSFAVSVRATDERSSFLLNISRLDGEKRSLGTKRWGFIYDLAWLSDGTGILLNGTEKDSKTVQIWLLSLPSRSVKRITNDANNYYGLSITSDNVSFVSGKLDRRFNLSLLGNGTHSKVKAFNFEIGKNSGVMGLALSQDGSIIFTSGLDGNMKIWRVNRDGKKSRQLTFGSGADRFPRITRDGRRIVFVSNRSGNNELWRLDTDKERPVPLTTTAAAESFPSLTPDGKWVIYQSIGADKKAFVWKIKIDGGEPIRITDFELRKPDVSPDGKLIAGIFYPNDDKSPPKLAVLSIDGGRILKLIDIPRVAKSRIFRWSADSDGFIYVYKGSGADNLWFQSLSGKSPTKLTDFDSNNIAYFEISKTGKEFLVARGFELFDVVMISNFR